MPPQNPLTRLHEVALGLRQLADGLSESGIDPINLRYWATELEEVRAELERAPAAEPGVASGRTR